MVQLASSLDHVVHYPIPGECVESSPSIEIHGAGMYQLSGCEDSVVYWIQG